MMVYVLLLASAATTFTGKVVSVADGDTITVLGQGNKPVRIRLHGVDCPEKRQPFGNRAKQFTSKMVFSRVVTVKVVTTDKYRRTVGEVLLQDRSLNEALVKAGLAWWYKRYAPRAKVLAVLEQQARQAKRGLWSDPNPVAPWTFRHRGKGLRCNVKSRVCHAPRCKHYRCRNCKVRFKSASRAKAARFRLHHSCVGARP